MQELLPVTSVADVGCGRGTWLAVWRDRGVTDVLGIDGAHVNQARLAIPRENFQVANLTNSWSIGRRFDLAQSLEVGEHLLAKSASTFVEAICALSDVVLFSAAVPGQGGEMHVNEQAPPYWARLFHDRGFAMYDCLRAKLVHDIDIEPWYRYNSFIYANKAGSQRLSHEALRCLIPNGQAPPNVSPMPWRLRKMLVKPLPVPVVTRISRWKYRATTYLRKTSKKSS